MKKHESKALEFIYQDTEIHYLFSKEEHVMINATEMANLFGKKPKDFLRTEETQRLIESLCSDENFIEIFNLGEDVCPRQEREKMILEVKSNGKNAGTWMHRILALEFASWLDTNFKIWILLKIDYLLFGHYKQHWDAHIKQEDAKERMETSKKKLLLNANQEDVIAYFEAEAEFKNAKNEKTKAILNQYRLFEKI
jgi:hypothetical protein